MSQTEIPQNSLTVALQHGSSESRFVTMVSDISSSTQTSLIKTFPFFFSSHYFTDPSSQLFFQCELQCNTVCDKFLTLATSTAMSLLISSALAGIPVSSWICSFCLSWRGNKRLPMCKISVPNNNPVGKQLWFSKVFSSQIAAASSLTRSLAMCIQSSYFHDHYLFISNSK